MTNPQRANIVETIMRELSGRTETLTEAEAAQLLNLSPSWFRAQFKHSAGVSFRQARLKAKLERGLHLLTHTPLSISQDQR